MYDQKTALRADPNPVSKPAVPRPKIGDEWEVVSSVEGVMNFLVDGGRNLNQLDREDWEAYGRVRDDMFIIPGDIDLRKLYDQPHPVSFVYSKGPGWHDPELKAKAKVQAEPESEQEAPSDALPGAERPPRRNR